MDVQLEIRNKSKRTVKQPSRAYRKTAAINLQSQPGFDQHKVIQARTLELGNYIIQVTIKKYFKMLINFFFSVLMMEKSSHW